MAGDELSLGISYVVGGLLRPVGRPQKLVAAFTRAPVVESGERLKLLKSGLRIQKNTPGKATQSSLWTLGSGDQPAAKYYHKHPNLL